MKKKDYLSCGALKIKMYKNYPHTLEDLTANKIQEKSANTNIHILQKLSTNIVKTIYAYNEGRNFQHS
jgi:hypothetical protein